MKLPLLALFLGVSCSPIGEIYSVRRAELQVRCDDTGPCDQLDLLSVPFEREEQVGFELENAGERALSVSITLDHAGFAVEPGTTNVASAGSSRFTVSYAPSSIEDQQADLIISHNAGGPPITIEVFGSTDPDADDDGFEHLSAPDGEDCNDFNAQVNPGADEEWYDGVDQDCDGRSDYDQDRDGYDIHTRPDGDDCNDEDPRIHPGAPDPVGDEIDSDCDGEDG